MNNRDICFDYNYNFIYPEIVFRNKKNYVKGKLITISEANKAYLSDITKLIDENETLKGKVQLSNKKG